MKFEITAEAVDTSLPLMSPGFVGLVNGHNYSKAATKEEAIAKASRSLANDLEKVTAAALFEAMAAEGDFAHTPFARALEAAAV